MDYFLWRIRYALYRFWRSIKRSKEDISIVANIITIIVFVIIFIQFRLADIQTRLLKEQVRTSNALSISQLGDRCLWNTSHGGDYSSYLILKKLEKETFDNELKRIISSQIRRVNDMYKSEVRDYFIEHQFAICKQGSDCREIEPKHGYSARNILIHMGRYIWIERAKAALFLRNIAPKQLQDDNLKWEDVFNPLVYAMEETEWSLVVRKTALDTYSQLSGFKSPSEDIFDFEGALAHWGKDGPEILKKQNTLLKEARDSD